MGTSSAFGGSRVWREAVDAFDTDSDPVSPGGTISPAFAHAMAKGLARGETRGRSYAVRDLLASHRKTSSSSASGDGRAAGSPAPFSRQAARGAIVLGALEAIENGDPTGLEPLGVDLSSLAGLSGQDLVQELIRLVLGPAAHPEDTALKRSILLALNEQSEGGSLQDRVALFVNELAWQTAVVQLSTSTASKPPGKLRELGNRVKRFIAGKVRRVSEQLAHSSPQVVAEYASRIADQVRIAFAEEA